MEKIIYCFSAILFAVLTLQSCDQEFDYIIEGEETLLGNKIIKKITSTQGGIANYFVEDNKVINISSTSGGAVFNFDISYDENNKVSSIISDVSSNIVFHYNPQGQLVSITGTEDVDPEDQFLQFFQNETWIDTEWDVNTVFEYNPQGKISKSKCVRLIELNDNDAAEAIKTVVTTTYTYAGNNFATYKTELEQLLVNPNPDFFEDEPIPYSKVTYQFDNLSYDNKLNVFTNVSLELLYAIQSGHLSGVGNGDNDNEEPGVILGQASQNNVVSGSSTVIIETNVEEANQTTTFDFQTDFVYDEDGYPSSSSSTNSAYSINYEYQPYTP